MALAHEGLQNQKKLFSQHLHRLNQEKNATPIGLGGRLLIQSIKGDLASTGWLRRAGQKRRKRGR
jgi:hypothetical protein